MESDTMLYDKIRTPLGIFIVVSDGRELFEVSYESKDAPGHDLSGLKNAPQTLRPFTSQIEAYLQGDLKRFDLPLHLSGTSFQNRVWSELTRIPFGETRSYEDIAKAVGNPAASRATGSACGRNPIAIVVPCHRVIAKNGGLGGYSGGLELKKALLTIEGFVF